MRERFRGEIVPLSAEQSFIHNNLGPQYAIDLDLQTQSQTFDNGSGRPIWLQLKLPALECIDKVVEFNSDGSRQYTWTCTDTDCSQCEGESCELFTLNVGSEGEVSGDLVSISDCKYGDTVVLTLHSLVHIMAVFEIAVLRKVPGKYLTALTIHYLLLIIQHLLLRQQGFFFLYQMYSKHTSHHNDTI